MKLFSETGYNWQFIIGCQNLTIDLKKDTSIDANFFAFLFFAKKWKKFPILWDEGEEIFITIAVGIYNLDFIA